MNLLLFGAPGTGKGTQSTFLISHYNLYHISTGDLLRKALRDKTPLGLKALSYMDRGALVPDSVVISLIEKVLAALSLYEKKKSTMNLDAHPSGKQSVVNLDAHPRKKGQECSEEKVYRGFILDGFPRTLAQEKALGALLKTLGLKLNRVVYLNVPDEVLVERIAGRRVAEKSGCVYHVKFNPPRREGICDKSGEKLVHRNDDKEGVVKQRLQAYYRQTAPLIECYRKRNILLELDGGGSPKEIFSRIQTALDRLP